MNQNKIELLEPEIYKKLTTQRLLSYYKKKRVEFFKLESTRYCKCCGALQSENNPKNSDYKKLDILCENLSKKLSDIKGELDKRENIT